MPRHEIMDVDAFRAGARHGEQPDGPVFRFATAEPQQVGAEAARTQRFVFSDATVDHSQDSIDPNGWDTSVFWRNPVALFSHMSWEPPIGRASNVLVKNQKLIGDIEFADADTYPFADTIYRLVKGKFINAVSVGFLPKEWAFSSDKNRPNGINFKKQLLLEISVCPVPCNPNALGEARSVGVDTRPLAEWAERALDQGHTVVMPRKRLETLRSQAREPGSRTLSRSATPIGHYATIQQVMTDLAASAETHRTTLGALKDIASDPGELDSDAIGHAVGQVAGAIACQERAITCLKAATNAAPGAQEPPPPAVAAAPKARAAQTPAERLAEVSDIRRPLERRAATPGERRVEAADLVRRLKADGAL